MSIIAERNQKEHSATRFTARESTARGRPVARPNSCATRAPAVILAAGRGSRLSTENRRRPKWLLPVNDTTIADRHLTVLNDSNRISDVTVVTGYCAEAIAEHIRQPTVALSIGTLWNPHYATKNNWYSLLLALTAVDRRARKAGLLVLNSDFWAASSVIAAYIEAVVGSSSPSSMAIDFTRPMTDEAMKVATSLPSGGKILDIGKTDLSTPGNGEYVGMAWIAADLIPLLTRSLLNIQQTDARHNDWYEAALKDLVQHGLPIHAWSMPSTSWVEIDSDADLHTAQSLL